MESSSNRMLALDLYLAFHAGHRHFNAELFKLMRKADPANLRKLAQVYPDEYEVYTAWLAAPSEGVFFKQHRLERLLTAPEERDAFMRRFRQATPLEITVTSSIGNATALKTTRTNHWEVTFPWGRERFFGSAADTRQHMERRIVKHMNNDGWVKVDD